MRKLEAAFMNLDGSLDTTLIGSRPYEAGTRESWDPKTLNTRVTQMLEHTSTSFDCRCWSMTCNHVLVHRGIHLGVPRIVPADVDVEGRVRGARQQLDTQEGAVTVQPLIRT